MLSHTERGGGGKESKKCQGFVACCLYPGDNPPLKVCYLRHAYGLGEHYNSVKPVESSDEEF